MPLFSQQKRTTDFRFFSLGSGSSGNCYFLGNSKYGILIDAGIGIRTIQKTLKEYGSSIDNIHGILVTHDHADHVKTVSYLAKKHNIPIYTTESVFGGIKRGRYAQYELEKINMRIITKETPFVIEDFTVQAFEVPHDSIDNNGFYITFEDQHFVLATDVGRMTPTIEQYIKLANHLVIEANYDPEMLRTGSYPLRLKERITCGMGHMSNDIIACALAENYTTQKNIWLCHLSKDNNTPDLAFDAVSKQLLNIGVNVGVDLKLEVLSRNKASGLRYF